jgi:hypothetical protein
MNFVRVCFYTMAAITFVASAASADDAAPAPAPAAPSGDVSVVRSQFTDKVEQSKPVAGADQLGQARSVTYWLEVKNAKEATQVTLVWKLDGHEAVRQTLDVGTAAAWKTWGSAATRGAKSIEVDVLDKSGATLKVDTLTL